ncbi:MAG: hypothetical protein RMN51_10860 [Verrucomicrobiota bacterium]|nr:hypothetical protein [Limisphaera sp.]MDW8382588.1 hypothetical protein [Verrucomicrobiota bacterium]
MLELPGRLRIAGLLAAILAHACYRNLMNEGLVKPVRRWSLLSVFVATAALGAGCTGPVVEARKPAPLVIQGALQDQKTSGSARKEQSQVITGSYIPRQVKRMGQTADTPFPVHILDGRDIERTGAGTVAEALRRVPAVR